MKALRRNPFATKKGPENIHKGENESRLDVKGTVSVKTSGIGMYDYLLLHV